MKNEIPVIMLCRKLLNDYFFLDHLNISEIRQQKKLDEVSKLCVIENR